MVLIASYSDRCLIVCGLALQRASANRNRARLSASRLAEPCERCWLALGVRLYPHTARWSRGVSTNTRTADADDATVHDTPDANVCAFFHWQRCNDGSRCSGATTSWCSTTFPGGKQCAARGRRSGGCGACRSTCWRFSGRHAANRWNGSGWCRCYGASPRCNVVWRRAADHAVPACFGTDALRLPASRTVGRYDQRIGSGLRRCPRRCCSGCSPTGFVFCGRRARLGRPVGGTPGGARASYGCCFHGSRACSLEPLRRHSDDGLHGRG